MKYLAGFVWESERNYMEYVAGEYDVIVVGAGHAGCGSTCGG